MARVKASRSRAAAPGEGKLSMEMRVKLDRVRLGDDPAKNFLVIMKDGKIRESTPRRCWTSPVPGVKLSQLYF